MSDEHEKQLIWMIASVLDHPSLYMGGPSAGNQRKAKEILKTMKYEGWSISPPKPSTGEDSE